MAEQFKCDACNAVEDRARVLWEVSSWKILTIDPASDRTIVGRGETETRHLCPSCCTRFDSILRLGRSLK